MYLSIDASKIFKRFFTPVEMTVIKKSTDNTCWRGYIEKGTLLHY